MFYLLTIIIQSAVREAALSSALHFSLIRRAFIYMTGLIISNFEQKLNHNKTGEVLLLSLILFKSVYCCHCGEYGTKNDIGKNEIFTKSEKSCAGTHTHYTQNTIQSHL